MKKIDEKDKKILELLLAHADYSTRKIAKETALPITTVHHRIRRLKREGVIKRFTVEVDHHQLDKGFLVYVLLSADLAVLKK